MEISLQIARNSIVGRFPVTDSPIKSQRTYFRLNSCGWKGMRTHFTCAILKHSQTEDLKTLINDPLAYPFVYELMFFQFITTTNLQIDA